MKRRKYMSEMRAEKPFDASIEVIEHNRILIKTFNG